MRGHSLPFVSVRVLTTSCLVRAFDPPTDRPSVPIQLNQLTSEPKLSCHGLNTKTKTRYPFQWNHIYIPLLPVSLNLHNVLLAPLPLFIGVCTDNSASLAEYLQDEGDMLAPLFVVDLDEGRIIHGGTMGTLHTNIRETQTAASSANNNGTPPMSSRVLPRQPKIVHSAYLPRVCVAGEPGLPLRLWLRLYRRLNLVANGTWPPPGTVVATYRPFRPNGGTSSNQTSPYDPHNSPRRYAHLKNQMQHQQQQQQQQQQQHSSPRGVNMHARAKGNFGAGNFGAGAKWQQGTAATLRTLAVLESSSEDDSDEDDTLVRAE